MPYRIKGISTLRYTPEEMTVPRLSHNGQCVEGWVMAPTENPWQPKGGDLLWLPPTATKSTDVDRAGDIVDVTWDVGEQMAFVTAELNKHERYLEMIRNKVRSGAVRLTSFLAKMLGLPFDDDGVELTPLRVGSGPLVATRTLAYKSAQAEELVAEGRRMAGMPVDRDTGLADPGAAEARIREVSHAAAAKYAETGDATAAMAELRAALARTSGKA